MYTSESQKLKLEENVSASLHKVEIIVVKIKVQKARITYFELTTLCYCLDNTASIYCCSINVWNSDISILI
jgi:hypothetical protein